MKLIFICPWDILPIEWVAVAVLWQPDYMIFDDTDFHMILIFFLNCKIDRSVVKFSKVLAKLTKTNFLMNTRLNLRRKSSVQPFK